jgi:protein involved in polysaccharide export with SLBB domain
LQEKIKLYENPQVSVKLRENNSHTYTVLGLVEKPGEKSLQREAYPLLVVRAESIVQAKADRAVIKHRNGQTENINLKDATSENVLVYSGDIVEFTSSDAVSADGAKQFYYIGGEIVSGGQKDFYKGITLTQAILASGGLKRQSAKKVVIRRKNAAGMLDSINVDLKAVKDGKAADPEIDAGDTIEIGN